MTPRRSSSASAIPTATNNAPTRNAAWYPPFRATWAASPPASSESVRDAATLAMTARPTAPPIMNEVFTTPDARPNSAGPTPLIAASRIGLNAMPAPSPIARVPGMTSSGMLPSTGVRANRSSPRAIIPRPNTSGLRIPKRITTLSDMSDEPPQMIIDGRYTRPTSSGVYPRICWR
ncbi:MAG TPA: hypothetical protein VL422_10710 [Miltoncostaea sp.]|nr:hypothetical protein [Miltoncostaea sp.]